MTITGKIVNPSKPVILTTTQFICSGCNRVGSLVGNRFGWCDHCGSMNRK